MSRGMEALESRQLLAGELDPTFGTNGVASTDLGSEMLIADVAVASDGSVVAVGAGAVFLPTGTFASAVIVRLRPDGSPDTRFAPDGVLFDSPGGMSGATGVEAVQSANTGRSMIYVAGVREDEELFSIVLARYTPLGRRDRSFGVQGRGSVRVPQFDIVSDIHVLSDGSILLAGRTAPRGDLLGFDAAVLKLRPNGRVDTTFGQNGLALTARTTGTTGIPRVMAVDLTGRILLGVGISGAGFRDEVVVRRFTSAGAIDATFGIDGTFAVPLLDAQGDPDVTIRGLAVDSSNRAYGYYGQRSGDQMSILRLLEDGQLDMGFGVDGIASIPSHFTGGPAALSFISIMGHLVLVEGAGDPQMFAGGATNRSGASVPSIVAMTSNGAAGDFGSSGVAQIGGVENAYAMLAPSPGAMLVALALPGNQEHEYGRELRIARFFTDARRSAVLNVKPVNRGGVSIGGDPAQLWVTYRHPDGIDLASIDDLDVRVTMPNGSSRPARVSKVEPNADDTAVTVRYKIPAPGGLWDAADNGDYVVRLIGRDTGVRTTTGDVFATSQILGVLRVDF